MNISSKFRQMYWARITIGLVIGITMSIKFLQMSIMENGRVNFEYAPFWIGILISIILIIQIISILSLQTIHVYNDKIVIKYLFFTTSKTLLYDSILRIERIKIQQMSKSGPVSDGYHLSALHLNNGKQEIISPDKFENYTEIIYAIRSNLDQYN